ncbi:MAG: hypothetical protein IKR73_00300 [Oscillospiraceae bacterium]|nr:hypothetical protein [Oscillospiraceae bacterium]
MRKTIKKVAAITFLAAFAAAAAVPASYIVPIGMTVSAEGETEGDPISISTEEELRDLFNRNATGLSGTVTLTKSIKLTNADPITINSPNDLTIDFQKFSLYRDPVDDIKSITTNSNIITITGSGSLTLKNGTISGGANSSSGGGIINQNKADLTLEKMRLTNNKTKVNGGGLWMSGGHLTLDTVTVFANEAITSGGGIFFSTDTYSSYTDTSKLTIKGSCTIGDPDPSSDTHAGNTSSNNGAGMYVGVSTLDIDDDASLYIWYNEVSGDNQGGGIFAKVKSSFTLKDNVTISHNKGGMGGGIAAAEAFTIDGATITHNEASKYGGGVYANKGITIKSGDISHNNPNTTSTNCTGGGIYVGNGDLEIASSSPEAVTIQDNNAANGGGVYTASSATVAIGGNKALISDNTASGKGGGIYTEGDTFITTAFPYICENTGGDIYLANNQKISLGAPFQSSPKIGVSMRSGSGQFTTNSGFDSNLGTQGGKWSKHDPTYYFTSDDSNYKVAHKKGDMGADDAYLVPADATPVSLKEYTKVKFAWSKDGTKCYFYGLQNGAWKKIGNATISGNTATYGGHTSTKPGTVPTDKSNAEVKVNFEKEDDAKNKLTLHMVCGSGSEDNIITVMGFEVTTVDASGAVVNTYDPLERTDVNALAGSYDVSVFVGAGKGVRVQPYYYIKAADDTAEGNGEKVMTDVYGTFYVTE